MMAQNKISKDVIGKYVIAVLTIFVLFTFNLPWIPEYFEFDVDASWIMVLHEYISNNWQFGKDIVWHYGPLGFLYAKYYHPDTFIYSIIGWSFFSLVFFWGSYLIIVRSHEKPNLIALPILAIIVSLSYDALFLAIPVITVFHYFFIDNRFRSPANIILIFASAAVAHIKISYWLLSVFLMLLLQVYCWARNQKHCWFIAVYLTFYLLLWGLLGQDINNLLPFIRGAYEHGSGFGTAMALHKTPYTVLLLYISGAIIFSYIIWKVLVAKLGKIQAWFTIVTIVASLYIAMKVGFLSGNDTHIFESVAVFIIIALLLRDIFFNETSSGQKNTLIVYCMVVVTFTVLSMFREKHQLEIAKFVEENKIISQSDIEIAPQLFSLFQDRKKTHEKYMAAIRDRGILPVDGSVDIYNNFQISAAAHGMQYKPRPVMQSYHVFTKYLTHLNKKYLQSGRAADNIIFRMETMLERFPATEDGLSWPELLTYYEIEKIHGSFLYLKKREKPRNYRIEKIKEVKTGFGQEITVPERDYYEAVWANIEMKPTILGRLANVIFRNIYTNMSFVTEGGYERTSRMVPAVASEGFVLSPLVDNTTHFALLETGDFDSLHNLKVRKIKFSPEYDNWWSGLLYNDEIKITFSSLNIEPTDEEIAGWKEIETLVKMTLNPQKSFVAPFENVVDQHISYEGNGADSFIRINGESKLYYPLNERETSVSGEFGIFNQFYFIKEVTKGMTFRIIGLSEDGEKKLLWQHDMEGMEEFDRGTNKTLKIEFESDIYKGLIFETDPIDDSRSNWSYWANMVIE